MTMGQKIAQKRKELGLSQEALGEQLGVSRQAIYKWESNATLPEIEKLIGLSRIFSVSVGWLLGEEETAPAEEGASASSELNEAQLQMVQEIVDRYLAARPVPAPAKRRRWWPLALAAAGGAAVLVALFHLSTRLNDLNSQYNNLQSSINNVTYSVNSQISSITNQVETILKSQNQLTASYDATLLSTDLAENTATFSVQAVPKSYVEGMTALFLADSGDGPVELAGELGLGQSFSAQLTCPLTDSITLSVVFQTEEQRETQVLEQFHSLYSQSFPCVNVMGSLWGSVINGVFSGDTVWVTSDPQEITYAVNAAAPPAGIAQIQVGLFRDQQLVMWYEELDGQPANFQGDFGNARFFQRSEPVTIEPDCVYCEAALVTDEYGRTFMAWDMPVQLDEEENFADAVDCFYSGDPAEWGL